MAKRINITKVCQDGETSGWEDYEGRARDVLQGADRSLAFDGVNGGEGADGAYLIAVGSEEVCKRLGINPDRWDDIRTEWCAAFRRGYEQALAEDDRFPGSL